MSDSKVNVFRFGCWLPLLLLLWSDCAFAQTNLAVIVRDGAWTWFNDPRAIFHNGVLYVGYVRNSDGASALSAFNPQTGSTTDLWTSNVTQRDDHNNPGLLIKQDGTMLAIYARHGTDQFFRYRLSSTDPSVPTNWSAELTIPSTGAGVTYANPFQLSNETNRIYNFMRDLNFNPTVVTSTNGGTNWSASESFIRNGAGSIRPYVKYCSDASKRIDVLYTDGHPRDITNSLYHLYYEAGACFKTDGVFLKSFDDLPIQHESGERGSIIYQYSAAATSDPDDHIPTGRAWCWQIAYQTNGDPVCVFSVQRDQVTGTNWFDARIYYYYARWTGSSWQKRFIAHAGRPLYTPENDYAGGICIDPGNPNVLYMSSNAENPFNLTDTTNVALKANARYELYRGTVDMDDLDVAWETVTTNSTADQLRPYVPPNYGNKPAVIWFRGTYTTYTAYNCEVVGLFSDYIPKQPRVQIFNPGVKTLTISNLANKLKLGATLDDDGLPQPATLLWTTLSGPTNAVFEDPAALSTFVQFPAPGTYTLRITANDGTSPDYAEVSVIAGTPTEQTNLQVLRLRLDETSGLIAADSSGSGHPGTLSGATTWQPGIRNGAIQFDGATGEIVVADAGDLDTTSAFTLAYWFQARGYAADSAGLVCKRNGAGDNNAYTTYLKTSDRRVYVDVDGSNNRFASATTVDTNKWYHLALTYDGSLPAAQRVKLWLDGTLDVTANEGSATIPNYTSNLRVGNTHNAAPNWFNGLIDDVRFYRRALASNEIVLLANTNVAPQILLGAAPAVTNRLSATIAGSITPVSSPVIWTQLMGAGIATFAASNSPSTGVMFSRSGEYNLRLVATHNLIEVSAELALFVSPNTNVFADWISFYFSGATNGAIVNEDADPDGDGVPNSVEFGLSLQPNVPETGAFTPTTAGLPIALIETHSGASYLTFRVKRADVRFDLEYIVQVSSNLAEWLDLIPESIVDNADSTEIVTYRDFVSTDSAPQRFIRFRVRSLTSPM